MKRLHKLILLAGLLLWAVGLSGARADSRAAPAADVRHQVMLILFRGMTDAERGFMKYFEEKKIPVDFIVRDAEGDATRLPGFAREIRTLRPDLVYTFGTTVTAAIAGTIDGAGSADVIRDIPIVFGIVADPVGARITGSLQSSSRNITGVSHVVPLPTQLKAMTSIVKVSRLAVVYNPLEKNSQLTVQALQDLAGEFKYSLEATPVGIGANGKPDPQTLPGIMASMLAKKPDAIYLPSDSFVIANAGLATAAAIDAGVPVFSATEDPIRKAGALAGLVSTYYNVGRFAAYKAEMILVQKKKPADIPIETLNRFTFLVHMKTAKALATYPPIHVMQTAEVIRE